MQIPNTPNIIAKLQVWLPKLTRVRFASLKKSPPYLINSIPLSFTISHSQSFVIPLFARVVFFGLPLHLWPPTCDRKGIMFRCIFRCKLGGWWLLIYRYRSAECNYIFLRNIGWFHIRLLWLSFSLSKLPF